MQQFFMNIYKNSLKTFEIFKDNIKTAGAVILQLALKLQKGNNFPVIPI